MKTFIVTTSTKVFTVIGVTELKKVIAEMLSNNESFFKVKEFIS